MLNEMIQQNITQVELAKRLNIHHQAVGRYLSLQHTTKIDALEEALNVLGKKLTLTVE